jgi:hypothetical protein
VLIDLLCDEGITHADVARPLRRKRMDTRDSMFEKGIEWD